MASSIIDLYPISKAVRKAKDKRPLSNHLEEIEAFAQALTAQTMSAIP